MKRRALKKQLQAPNSTTIRRNSKPYRLGTDHPLFPACDGAPWKEDPQAGPYGKIKRQFLEAYFLINLAYARLVAFRKSKGITSPRARERAILQKIERALLAREALEDQYASRGIAATAVYRDGFTVNLSFTDPHTSRQRERWLVMSSSSARINIPLPADLPTKLCKS